MESAVAGGGRGAPVGRNMCACWLLLVSGCAGLDLAAKTPGPERRHCARPPPATAKHEQLCTCECVHAQELGCVLGELSAVAAQETQPPKREAPPGNGTGTAAFSHTDSSTISMCGAVRGAGDMWARGVWAYLQKRLSCGINLRSFSWKNSRCRWVG